MHDDSRNAAQLLATLILSQETVAREQLRVQARIAKLRDTDRALRLRYVELENAIHDVRIRARGMILPTSARPSPKNLGFLRSWAALRQAIAGCDDPSGLPHYKVARVISQAVPGIRDATIRSHLHRLRKRGLLEKVGSSWRLTARGAQDVDQAVDEDPTNETPEERTLPKGI